MTLRRLRIFVPIFCAFTLSIAMPLKALAFDFFGLTLFEDTKTADANSVIADPQLYTAQVNVTGDTALDDTVRGASVLWNKRDTPASGAAGLLATARSDYRRIVAALYAEGYYGGIVTIKVDGREATAIAPDSDLNDPANVFIQVQTGSQFYFGATKILNRAPETTQSTVDALKFKTGSIARAGAVRQAARGAIKDWRQLGYPKAKIADQAVVADHKNDLVDVTLTVEPGRQAVIGAISVEGATDMSPAFIARQAGLSVGEIYNPDNIARAQRRLNDLGVFGTVKIVEAENISPDGTLPLRIVVQERKPRRVGAGATFSSTDGLGIETFWLHRNLFGEGERLKLDARLAGIAYPINSADFDYYFGGTFTKPGILTPDTDLIAALVAQRTVLSRYTETSVEGLLGVAHEISPELKAEAGVELKRANFYDDLYGSRNFSVFGTYGTLTYDTRDDANDASTGIYAWASAKPFYEAEHGSLALLLAGEVRSYLSLTDDERVVLAARLKAGLLFGPSIAQTPPDRLFFAGGGGSVRGFPYHSIGVDGPGGTFVGGKFLTEASFEARVKVTNDIGLVGFIDAGYVTANNFVGLGQGARLGVGAGLRYYTGFGPLRLDFAVPLNKRAGDPDYAIYLGIGQAF